MGVWCVNYASCLAVLFKGWWKMVILDGVYVLWWILHLLCTSHHITPVIGNNNAPRASNIDSWQHSSTKLHTFMYKITDTTDQIYNGLHISHCSVTRVHDFAVNSQYWRKTLRRPENFVALRSIPHLYAVIRCIMSGCASIKTCTGAEWFDGYFVGSKLKYIYTGTGTLWQSKPGQFYWNLFGGLWCAVQRWMRSME